MDREQALMDATNFWENPQVAGKSVDLLGFATVFVRRWPFLVMMTFAGFLLALGIAFAIPPQFTSRAVFLPPSQQVSAADNPLSLFLHPPSSSIYIGLLNSDSVMTDVVTHGDLERRFRYKDIDQARKGVRASLQATSDASGFVTLEVTERDPHLAQEIANDLLAALSRLNDRLAGDEAEEHRQLFQGEFEKAKNDLERSEVELKKAQEASGVVSPESQIRSGLSAIDMARADIRAKQVALAALEKSETDQAPEVQRLRSEIGAEESQLAGLESSAGAGPGTGLSAKQAPAVSLRFVQLDREVKYNQVLFDVMAKQLENARLEKSSAAPGVQVVDFPELPLHKSKPSRMLIAAGGLLAGFFLGLSIVLIRNRLEVLEQDPIRAAALRSLRGAFRHPKLNP